MDKTRRRIGVEIVLGIATLLVLFSIAAEVIGYSKFTEAQTAFYKDNTRAIAGEAAAFVDVGSLDKILATGGDCDEYRETIARLRTLCDHMDAAFIYVVDVSDDCGTFTYLLEAVNEKMPFDPFPVGYEQNIAEGEYVEYRDRVREMRASDADEEYVVRDRGHIETGFHVTAFTALRDGNGNFRALLGVQKQMDYLYGSRTSYLIAISTTTVAMIGLACLAWFIYMRRRVIGPIRRIDDETRRFAAENTLPASELASRVTYNDELGSLARTIDEMERKTLDYFTTLSDVTAEKKRIDSELELATVIQSNLLPREFPPFPAYAGNFDIFAAMDPAKEVGGDFYDFFMTDETHIAVVIADVSGKGVPAALYMMIAKTLIKIHMTLGLAPSETFAKVNDLLCANNTAGIFVTAWMGVLDITTGRLEYVNAGHNPPLVRLGGGNFEYLRMRSGLVLAGMEGMDYKSGTLTMEPGDRLFLYTDGITEAIDGKPALYGEERLHAWLGANGSLSASELLSGVRRDVDAFAAGTEQFDDMTMLVLDFLKRK